MRTNKIADLLRAVSGSGTQKAFTSAIIVAAGLSERFGGTRTKQMTLLCGTPVLIHTLTAYQKADSINEIIVVARPDEIEAWKRLCSRHGINKLSKIVEGGATRQDSVLCGFEAINEDARFVAIADGARCLTTPEQINEVCRAAYKYDAATAAHRSTDTVKVANRKGFIDATADRDIVWLAQTPQVFKVNLYRAAAYTALQRGFIATDDNSLVEELGGSVRLVECGAQNIKITTQEDMAVAAGILAKRKREAKKNGKEDGLEK
ncbi:MAG: 2-C-methyl-D-erythritol 4-phosphate cytidylyltransferase [Ruminococcaceae bacterium]|nr:2-C-methyl-D-erythritol 4-phosphate cytidylyltransferase [Oscillospiraceae bacterium]